ncbi:hypothetical protein [Pontibacillus salipaludis]|uniref:Uncharacterized protein n=1 Tax=Pontibacillus salipaludis TaxID=1697394 RepID=A0ABQ1PZZ8_9BACI|nr:hypothetical protein [Pontibacillus salipaludis]GGD08259.1 hypothetical protein GCM10011389_14770 [Pontibacillus salipaludis]
MSNKKLSLSKDGKELLDELVYSLDLDRPLVINIALAKGLTFEEELSFDATSKPKWTIPENIIRDKEFLLFKHLIISKRGTEITEETIHNDMLYYIELGIRVLSKAIQEKNSLEDSRFVII